MYNFKLKSFLGSIIFLGGLLLSACNGGGSGGGAPILGALSVTPLLESSSIESNGATYAFISRSGDLSNQLTVAVQSNDSSMSVDKSSVIIKANESYTYVKVNGVKIGSAALQATAIGYTESSVGFRIESAPLFSCVADISNPNYPNLCGCLNQNDGSGLTWYNYGSQNGNWKNWCSSSGGVESDSICYALNSSRNGILLNSFNTYNHCGYSDWHLPTMITPGAGDGNVESSGGNWGDIGTYAINNGYRTDDNKFGKWLAKNFIGVKSRYYWSSASYDSVLAWGVNMNDGFVGYTSVLNTSGVLVVRGSR